MTSLLLSSMYSKCWHFSQTLLSFKGMFQFVGAFGWYLKILIIELGCFINIMGKGYYTDNGIAYITILAFPAYGFMFRVCKGERRFEGVEEFNH